MTLEPSLELSPLGPGNISHHHWDWDRQDKIHMKHFDLVNIGYPGTRPTRPTRPTRATTDLNPQHGAGSDGARLVSGLADVDSLVAGVEVVDADPSIAHDLNILRQTLGSALSRPLDIRRGVSTNLGGVKNIRKQTDNYMSSIVMEIIIRRGGRDETSYYCMKADS